MVRAGHMDAIDEIFAERRMKEAVATPRASKECEEVEASFRDAVGGVLLGLACIAPFVFLAAVL